jgi:hypothetical protein
VPDERWCHCRGGLLISAHLITVVEHQDGLFAVEVWVLALQVVELGHVVDGDVGMRRVRVQGAGMLTPCVVLPIAASNGPVQAVVSSLATLGAATGRIRVFLL